MNKFSILVLLTSLIFRITYSQTLCGGDINARFFNGSCYRFFDKTFGNTFIDNENYCIANFHVDSHLVSLHSQEEYDLVNDMRLFEEHLTLGIDPLPNLNSYFDCPWVNLTWIDESDVDFEPLILCITNNLGKCFAFSKDDDVIIEKDCTNGNSEFVCKYDLFCQGSSSREVDVCSSHGVCYSTDVCTCEEDYYGEACEVTTCFSFFGNDSANVCNSNGNCTSKDRCICENGYYGVNCTFLNPSKGDLPCDEDECVCEDLYFGSNCSEFTCFGESIDDSDFVCSGNGVCVGPDICVCNEFYAGENCELTTCWGDKNDSRVCSGRGTCWKHDQCICEEGYAGNNCELENVCSLPGDISDLELETCFHLYDTVDDFQMTWFSADSFCSKNWMNGGKVVRPTTLGKAFWLENNAVTNNYWIGIKNDPGCSVLEDLTSPYEDDLSWFFNNYNLGSCNGNDPTKPCIFENIGGLFEIDDRACKDVLRVVCDFDIPYCHGIYAMDTSTVCSGKGLCVDTDDCRCSNPRDYIGEECQVTTCDRILSNETDIVCSSHGSCWPLDTCDCNEGYVGQNCGITTCSGVFSNDTSVCNGYGTCWPKDTCICFEEEFERVKPPLCENRTITQTCSAIEIISGSDEVFDVVIFGSVVKDDIQMDLFVTRISNYEWESTKWGNVFGHEFLFSDEFSYDDVYLDAIHLQNGDFMFIGSNSPRFTLNRIRHLDGSLEYTYRTKSENEVEIIAVREDLETENLYILGKYENGIHVTKLVSFGSYVGDLGYHFEENDLEPFGMAIIGPDYGYVVGRAGMTSVDEEYIILFKMNLDDLSVESLFSFGRNDTIEVVERIISCEDCVPQTIVLAGQVDDSDSCLFLYFVDVVDFVTKPVKGIYVCHQDLEFQVNDIDRNVYGNGFIIVGSVYRRSNSSFSGFILSVVTQDLDNLFVDSLELYIESERFTSLKKIDDRVFVLSETRNFNEEEILSKCRVIEFLGSNNPSCFGDSFEEIIKISLDELVVNSSVQMNVSDQSSSYSSFTISEFETEISWMSSTLSESVDVFSFLNMNITNQSCGIITECFGYRSVDTGYICGGHGECILYDTCLCDENYTVAEDCTYYECFGKGFNDSLSCSGEYGNCTGHNECDCKDGYLENECEEWKCGGLYFWELDACHGNGSCLSPEFCDCDTGYSGTNCEFFICYGFENYEIGHVCGGHGVCFSPGSCECEVNYTSVSDCSEWTCFGVLMNDTDSNVCSGYGNCTGFDECSCLANYTSSDCSDYFCNETIFSDSENVCSGRGNCTSPEVCLCDESYYGNQCQFYSTICFGYQRNDTENVCGGHGRCLTHDTCECEEGYDFALDCSFWYCYGEVYNISSIVCSEHGDCVGSDNCTCEYGYGDVSQNCETFSCFGILENNNSNSYLCSGHGICSSYDTCDCDTGYNGTECESWECFGVDSILTSVVCSGHGNCYEPENCTCFGEYFEERCEIWHCFDIGSDLEDEVCSGNGDCLDVDFCDCHDGYNGTTCNEWKCNGIDNLSDENQEGCSQRGTCIGPDECECAVGYEGQFCETFSCGGIDYQHPQTCNSRGTCYQPDLCICNKTTTTTTSSSEDYEEEKDDDDHYGIYGKICGTKFGTTLVRATKKTLVVFFEISEIDFRGNEGLVMEEPFPCDIILNLNNSVYDYSSIFENCELSNNNEFLEVSGSSVFLKFYLSEEIIETEEIFSDVMRSLNGQFDLSIENDENGDPKIHRINYFEDPEGIVTNSEITYTIRNFEPETDEKEKKLLLCKERLHLQDICFQTYECLESPFSSSELQKELTYFSLGYMPIPGTSEFGMSKHYYRSKEDCEKGRFENFLLYTPQRCYGSSTMGDNFIIYERCSSDVLSVFGEQEVIFIFGNMTLYTGREILRKTGVVLSDPWSIKRSRLFGMKKNDSADNLTLHTSVKDEVSDSKEREEKYVVFKNPAELVNVRTMVRCISREFLSRELDNFDGEEEEELRSIEKNTESEISTDYTKKKKDYFEEDYLEDYEEEEDVYESSNNNNNNGADSPQSWKMKKIRSEEVLRIKTVGGSGMRRISTTQGLVQYGRRNNGFNNNVNNFEISDELEEGGGGDMGKYVPTSVDTDDEWSSDSNESADGNSSGEGFVTSSLLENDHYQKNDHTKITKVMNLSPKIRINKISDDDDNDSSYSEDDDDNSSYCEEEEEEDGERVNRVDKSQKIHWKILKIVGRAIYKLLCCLCCPLWFHREILKVMVMICSILLFEALHLWFSSSEFLDTSEVDEYSRHYILVNLVVTLLVYVIWGSMFVYIVLLFIVIFLGVGVRFMRSSFLFIISYGNLRENVFFRLFKVTCLGWFFSINLSCFLIKFFFQSSDEQRASLITPVFYFSFLLPQGLLVYDIIQVLSYNGSSSRGMVDRIKKDLGCCGLRKFPKVVIPIWDILKDTDSIIDEFLKTVLIVNNYNDDQNNWDDVKDEKMKEEIKKKFYSRKVKSSLELSLFKKSEEFGHLEWDILTSLTFGEIKFLHDLFFPEHIKRRDYKSYFCYERITSWRWWASLCMFPFLCLCSTVCCRTPII